mmetsp:Transcript_16500/g.20897  ORF Transcript_16500/g.20897 Transcript_16500/m.20897 type:complete len:89 (-) Transcript_16500:534-800(-)
MADRERNIKLKMVKDQYSGARARSLVSHDSGEGIAINSFGEHERLGASAGLAYSTAVHDIRIKETIERATQTNYTAEDVQRVFIAKVE